MSECLQEWVLEDFGIALASVDKTAYGADEAAELWRGEAVDGKGYAVKLSEGGDPAGLMVSAHLAAHGVPGVPAPVRTNNHRLWTERDGRRLSVVPWVSDNRALSSGMAADQWTSFGALLARVHDTRPLATLPREEHTHERVTATVRTVDDLSADPGDRLAETLVDRWSAAAGVVSALVERADRLGRELRTRSAPEVVCHGDPHLGNVLLGNDRRVWLIDWDDAVLAPRERDLMFVTVGVLLPDIPVTAEQQSWFFEGYGPAELDPTRLAYYRCTRALEDLAYPAVQIMSPYRSTDAERTFALSIVEAVLAPAGLAEFALSG